MYPPIRHHHLYLGVGMLEGRILSGSPWVFVAAIVIRKIWILSGSGLSATSGYHKAIIEAFEIQKSQGALWIVVTPLLERRRRWIRGWCTFYTKHSISSQAPWEGCFTIPLRTTKPSATTSYVRNRQTCERELTKRFEWITSSVILSYDHWNG